LPNNERIGNVAACVAIHLLRSYSYSYSCSRLAGSVVAVSVPDEGSYPIRSESYDCLSMMKRIERSQQEAVNNNYQAHKFCPISDLVFISASPSR
jgi:hypothetical protein